jgi:hypothetical protein
MCLQYFTKRFKMCLLSGRSKVRILLYTPKPTDVSGFFLILFVFFYSYIYHHISYIFCRNHEQIANVKIKIKLIIIRNHRGVSIGDRNRTQNKRKSKRSHIAEKHFIAESKMISSRHGPRYFGPDHRWILRSWQRLKLFR